MWDYKSAEPRSLGRHSALKPTDLNLVVVLLRETAHSKAIPVARIRPLTPAHGVDLPRRLVGVDLLAPAAPPAARALVSHASIYVLEYAVLLYDGWQQRWPRNGRKRRGSTRILVILKSFEIIVIFAPWPFLTAREAWASIGRIAKCGRPLHRYTKPTLFGTGRRCASATLTCPHLSPGKGPAGATSTIMLPGRARPCILPSLFDRSALATCL